MPLSHLRASGWSNNPSESSFGLVSEVRRVGAVRISDSVVHSGVDVVMGWKQCGDYPMIVWSNRKLGGELKSRSWKMIPSVVRPMFSPQR